MSLERFGQLRTLIPLVLIGFLALDVGLRFVPLDFLTFRGLEAMSRYPVAEGPFEPNKRYYNSHTHGDLANMANLPQYYDYRSETFTSDSLGFRNPPDLCAHGPPDVLLIGSSFCVGVGASDEETLSAQLGRLTGRIVYNASGLDPEPDRIRSLARQLGMNHGLVICEHLERYDLPLIPPPGAPGGAFEGGVRLNTPEAANERLPEHAGFKQRLKGWGLFQPARRLWWWVKVSPLEIAFSRGFRSLQNDRVLPNPFRSRVAIGELRNGEWMVFPANWKSSMESTRNVERGRQYWSWVARELRKDDLTLAILLLPEKQTVYGRFLAHEPESPQAGSFLERMHTSLENSGVQVISLTEALCQEAAEGMDRHELVYWRDDTHWNPRGISVAAEELRQSGLLESSPLGVGHKP